RGINLEDAQGAREFAVPLLSLDSEFPSSSACPALVKVDVEYMEGDVVRGAEQMLKRCSPVLLVEYNFRYEDDPLWDQGALPLRLIELGYSLHWALSSYCRLGGGSSYFDPTDEQLEQTSCSDIVSENLLAIPSGHTEADIVTRAYQLPPWPLTPWLADR
ncbi:unnamed protein product, partial [Chrysoparadoxa australica]